MSVISIKTRLKVKHAGVNFSKKRLDAIADKLNTKLGEDAEDEAIDSELDALNEIFPFADLAKNDDRLRNIDAKEKDTKSKTEESKTEDPAPDGQPDIAKIIQAALAPLTQEIASLKAGKTTDSRRTQLEAVLKDVNPKFKDTSLKAFGRMVFETDEDFEVYKDELTTDAKEFVQSEADTKMSGSIQPIMGVTNKAGITTDTAAYIAEKQAAAKGEGAVAGKSVF